MHIGDHLLNIGVVYLFEQTFANNLNLSDLRDNLLLSDINRILKHLCCLGEVGGGELFTFLIYNLKLNRVICKDFLIQLFDHVDGREDHVGHSLALVYLADVVGDYLVLDEYAHLVCKHYNNNIINFIQIQAGFWGFG
ncbi:MAG: hypothetical protein ACKO96_21455, partial [Flammeovirgaceae bacterium]